MLQQVEFALRPRPRGFHLVTDEVLRQLPELPRTGLLHLFIKHTSCGLSVCENAELTLPITNGRLNLWTWQGIYLCEFRNHGGSRRVVATILGE